MAVRNSWLIQMTSMIVLTFSLVLLGIIFSFIKSSQYAAVKSQQSVKLELFFKQDLKSDTDFQWVDQIKSIPEVLNISFLTQAQAQEEFKKMMISSFGSLTEEASLLSRLPSSVSVQFQEGVSALTKKQKVDDIVSLAQQIPSYDGHVYQQDWAEWLSLFTQKAEKGMIFLGAFVFLIFFLIISNVIRSQVAHKQEEIEIRSFLGATLWQIEKPFIVNSVFLGVLSSIIASSIIMTLVQLVKIRLQGSNELISADLILAPSIVEVLIVMVIVTAISIWAARACVRERVLL
jgi:cell division transport system permease protein